MDNIKSFDMLDKIVSIDLLRDIKNSLNNYGVSSLEDLNTIILKKIESVAENDYETIEYPVRTLSQADRNKKFKKLCPTKLCPNKFKYKKPDMEYYPFCTVTQTVKVSKKQNNKNSNQKIMKIINPKKAA